MNRTLKRIAVVAVALPFLYLFSFGCGGGGDGTVAGTEPLAPGTPGTNTLSAVVVGSGTVTSSAAGIDCGASCSAAFETGTEVTLTASPADIWSFVVWSGDCSGAVAAVPVTVDADKSCTATFSMLPWAKAYSAAADDDAFVIAQGNDGYAIAGMANSFGAGDYDFFVMKTDEVGIVSWQKSFGGAASDVAQSAVITSDGGVLVAGDSSSFGAADLDFLVLKLAADGSLAWQMSYDDGSLLDDASPVVRELADGSILLAGTTTTLGAGDLDLYILLLDASGGIVQEFSYGNALNDEELVAIEQTADGGYILAATSYVILDGYVPDLLVVKLSSAGAIEWQKLIGFPGVIDTAGSVRELAAGGYILAGSTAQSGDADFYVLKLDAAGNIAWQKSYGRVGYDDSLNSIRETADGGFVAAGDSVDGTGLGDFLALKLSAAGGILWQKLYGAAASSESAHLISENADGSFIVIGSTAADAVSPADILALRVLSDGSITFTAASGLSATDAGLTAAAVGGTSADAVLATPAIAGTATPTVIAGVDQSVSVIRQAP